MPVSCAHPPGLPTDVFACPTLYTQPHFYKSSPEVVASSGGGWMGWLSVGVEWLHWLLASAGACTLLHWPLCYLSCCRLRLPHAGRTWSTSFKDHGWYFSVEPFSGMSIHGHKPYQFNHLVQRTDVAYPNLWVANGSAASQLGQALGMDGDFVTGESRALGMLWCLSARVLRSCCAHIE